MNRISPKEPNDREKWDAFIDYTLILERCATNDETIPLPIGKIPSPELDKQCGGYLAYALTEPDPDQCLRRAPDHLRPWIAARMVVANWYAGNIQKRNGKFVSRDCADMMKIMTIVGWSDNLHQVWPRFFYDNGVLTCGPVDNDAKPTVVAAPASDQAGSEESEEETGDDFDDLDDSDLEFEEDEEENEGGVSSWAELYDIAEMLLAALGDQGKIRLPVGKMPTPPIDAQCDKAFEAFFRSSDPRSILKSPVHLRGWMGARLAVALLFIKGASLQGTPFPEDNYTVLPKLVIADWYGPMRELWLKYSYDKNGKLEFRYEGNEGATFKPN